MSPSAPSIPTTEAPILVLSAVASELGNIAGKAITTRAVGVGVIEAALTLSDPGLAGPWSSVWFLGTAGTYRAGELAPGDAVVAERHVWVPQSVPSESGYLPEPIPTVSLPALPPLHLEAIPRVGCATTPTITTDPVTAAAIADGYQVEVEHLEAFAIARWCETNGFPFAAVLGISNVVGPSAHRQWTENREAAEGAARRAFSALLR